MNTPLLRGALFLPCLSGLEIRAASREACGVRSVCNVTVARILGAWTLQSFATVQADTYRLHANAVFKHTFYFFSIEGPQRSPTSA